jgi:hypothetical protein
MAVRNENLSLKQGGDYSKGLAVTGTDDGSGVAAWQLPTIKDVIMRL